ncbi:MAG: MFS transporter [Chromatiaceae bacterium]|nr:MAG: MFS transporter [Chromatiaceae bacterium]
MIATPAPATPLPALNALERRSAIGLAAIFAMRMLGLFMILPVFVLHAHALDGATPALVGLAIGAYGLTQALFQIPFGLASDRLGRKPVIHAGLLIFALGSVLAAVADSIQAVIIGRALQGSGAIAAASIALAADLTRESVRTRAMAAIGISVALSFAAALVLGPVLGELIGISGIFWLTAALAILGMLVLALLVPTPACSRRHRDVAPVLGQLGSVLRDGRLLRLDAGMFLLHLGMVSLFVVLPLTLTDAGLPAARQWQLYLPVVLLSIGLMIPFILLAERGGRVKAVLLGAAAALVSVMIALAVLEATRPPAMPWLLAAALVVMFTVFNLKEAILPALVSKAARAGDKGTATGVFSSSQFVGAFLGGLSGGLVHQAFGSSAVYLIGAGTALLWLAVLVTLRPPGALADHILPLAATPATDTKHLRARLLAVPGVEDALIAADEGVAHLKVDSARLDWARLKLIAAAP